MLTVPPAAQTTLAAYTDAELRTALQTALRECAYGLWEAQRRGFQLSVRWDNPGGTLNTNQARELLVTATKTVEL